MSFPYRSRPGVGPLSEAIQGDVGRAAAAALSSIISAGVSDLRFLLVAEPGRAVGLSPFIEPNKLQNKNIKIQNPKNLTDRGSRALSQSSSGSKLSVESLR